MKDKEIQRERKRKKSWKKRQTSQNKAHWTVMSFVERTEVFERENDQKRQEEETSLIPKPKTLPKSLVLSLSAFKLITFSRIFVGNFLKFDRTKLKTQNSLSFLNRSIYIDHPGLYLRTLHSDIVIEREIWK